LISAFFLVSGGTALVYQVIWVRILGLIVGHSTLAIATVIATYMAGLGLGASIAGRRADRVARPLFAYGLLEAAIGVFALLSPTILRLLTPLTGLIDTGPLAHLAPLFAGGIALLPPTIAMGATLPLLTSWYARDNRHLGRDMGWLYAINTTGAFLGAGLAGFVLLPHLGQPLSLAGAASANLTIAVGAMLLGRHHRYSSRPEAPAELSTPAPLEADSALVRDARPRLILIAFALSGCAAMVNQVAWSRSFSLFTGSTTYAFSLIVCAFIAGLAIGGHLLSTIVDRVADRVALLAALNVAIAGGSALLIPIIGELPLWLLEPLAQRADSFLATQAFLFGLLFLLVFLPTLMMGGTYAVTTRLLSHSADDAPAQVGRAYAWNTSGAILGSLAAGLLLIPLLQLRGTLCLAVAINLIAAAVLLAPRTRLAWALPAIGGIALLATPAWNPRHMNLAPHLYARDLMADPTARSEFANSGSIRFHEEGLGATVTVIQRSSGARVLRIDGKTDASTEVDRLTQGIVGSLPLLLSKRAEDVLLIGLGSGMTLASVLEFPVSSVRTAELLPEVIRAATAFGEVLGHPLDDPRSEVVLADGRHLLQTDNSTYDVISSQPTNLFISGMSTMFTAETFEAIRGRLRPGGITLVWLQSYQLRDADFRTVLATFLSVFPEAHLWSASPFDLMLTGHLGPLSIDPSEVDRRLGQLGSKRLVEWTGLSNFVDLQRHYLLGPAELEKLAVGARIQHDRDPFLEFTAPRALYGDAVQLDIGRLITDRRRLPLAQTQDGATEPRSEQEAIEELLVRRLEATLAIERAILAGDGPRLDLAHRSDPGNAFGRGAIARQLFRSAVDALQRGDLSAAKEQALRGLALTPDALPLWSLLVQVHHQQGDIPAAIAALEAAIRRQPSNPYPHLEKASYLGQLGRTEEANEALTRVRELDPALPELERTP
jgi:spermidine synthase